LTGPARRAAVPAIAHILPWPTIGGVERATLRIAEALPAEHFRHVFFCVRGATPIKEVIAAAGYEVSEYEPAQVSYRHPGPFLHASRELAADFKRRRIDLVHASDLLAGFHVAVAGKIAKLPVICHIRCRFDKIPLRERIVLGLIRQFVFVSHDTARHFGDRLSARRGLVIYDGIEEPPRQCTDRGRESVIAEFGVPGDAVIVGTLGHISPSKDYVTLIEAASRIVQCHRQVRFVVIGDYSTQPVFREHLARLRVLLREKTVEEYFIFTGFRRDVPRMIDAMDLLVLCSPSEGVPLSIMEAMAQKKPVAATRVGGIPEIVVDGTTGLLHAYQDSAKLAADILSLIRNPDEARRFGAAGYERIRTVFAKQRFAGQIEHLYRQRLGERPLARTGHQCVASAVVGSDANRSQNT
jgi:glycosyltransferase involved in cell wall biosynthesis